MEIINSLRVPTGAYKVEGCHKSQILAKQAEIAGHHAWHGPLSGIKSEEILQKKPVGSYVLRQGETDNEYYLSWMSDTECNICLHRPFCLVIDQEEPKWLHKNGQVDCWEKLEDIIEEVAEYHSRDRLTTEALAYH